MNINTIRADRYLLAMFKLWVSGKGLLSEAEIEERFAECRECTHFTGRNCDLCGCCTNGKTTHFNKLAIPTEACPDGRWQSQ